MNTSNIDTRKYIVIGISFNPLQPGVVKPKGFPMFSGGLEKQYRAVMD